MLKDAQQIDRSSAELKTKKNNSSIQSKEKDQKQNKDLSTKKTINTSTQKPDFLKKPSFFKKEVSKNSTVELKKELEEIKKSHRYLKAEFINYKKQMEKEKQDLSQYANFLFIQELLMNVLNDFDRAIEKKWENHNFEDFKTGVQMLHQQFIKHLKKYGVEEINPVHQEIFDPQFHEVLSVQVKEKLPANTVIQVCRKGYKIKNRLIQPAQVIVSKTE